MYHQISAAPVPAFSKYVVTTRVFARHMHWLALAGYTSVGLEASVGPRTDLPRRPVIITFDDGYRECAQEAVPILCRWGFVGTFFLVAGLMGKTSRWLVGERGIEFALMDWSTARRL